MHCANQLKRAKRSAEHISHIQGFFKAF